MFLRHLCSGRCYARLWELSIKDEDETLPSGREFTFLPGQREGDTCEQLSAVCYTLSLMTKDSFVQSFLLLVWEKDERWVFGRNCI